MAAALRNRSKFNHRAAAYHRITARFPDRFWLGLGAGHPEHTDRYVKPLAALNQLIGTEHVPHPDLPDVTIQVYGDEILAGYKSLAGALL
jgi:hypothetical protein